MEGYEMLALACLVRAGVKKGMEYQKKVKYQELILWLEYERVKHEEEQAIMKMAVTFSEEQKLSVEKTELIMKVKGGQRV